MLVVTRYLVDPAGGLDPDEFLARAETALAALGQRPGFRTGRVGRAVDDPSFWVIATEWEHVGAYRRALSAYEVKVHAVPLLSLAVDEPSAYEVLVSAGSEVPPPSGPGRGTDRAADADRVGPGSAAAPSVPTDLGRRHQRPAPS